MSVLPEVSHNFRSRGAVAPLACPARTPVGNIHVVQFHFVFLTAYKLRFVENLNGLNLLKTIINLYYVMNLTFETSASVRT